MRNFILVLIVYLCSLTQLPITSSFSITEWIHGEDNDVSNSYTPKDTLSMLDISEMRVRDIKRRLARHHGYGSDEIAKMIDKKELINALSYEEHKAEQKETARKKRVALRRSIIVALICIIAVMFKPLFAHVFEVAHVNFVVYTGRLFSGVRLSFFMMRSIDIPQIYISILFAK